VAGSGSSSGTVHIIALPGSARGAGAVDAQIEFVRGEDGKVSGLIFRQGPVEARAQKQ
jgi:hypothetical protein